MRQTILAVVLIAVIAAAGFLWSRYGGSGTAPSETAGLTSTIGERLAQYESLQRLQPDISVLADPLFRSLRPAAPPLAIPQGGRTNPFAPF